MNHKVEGTAGHIAPPPRLIHLRLDVVHHDLLVALRRSCEGDGLARHRVVVGQRLPQTAQVNSQIVTRCVCKYEIGRNAVPSEIFRLRVLYYAFLAGCGRRHIENLAADAERALGQPPARRNLVALGRRPVRPRRRDGPDRDVPRRGAGGGRDADTAGRDRIRQDELFVLPAPLSRHPLPDTF